MDVVFGHSTEATTLFLTITESANRNSSLKAVINTPNPTTVDVDNAEQGAARLAVQRNRETMQPMTAATLPPLCRTGDLPSEGDTPPVQPVVGSQPETSRTALRRAEEATNNISTIKTWKHAVTNLKWVMDTVTPIAAVCPISFLPIRR
jgi:phage tail sheath protein FI